MTLTNKLAVAFLALSITYSSHNPRPEIPEDQPLSLEEFLKQDGYTQGPHEFPHLNVTIPKKEGVYFKEKQVESIPKAKHELLYKYQVTGFQEPYEDILGIHLGMEAEELEIWFHTNFIREDLPNPIKINTIGHEQGHFIWAINNQDLIYNQLKKPELVTSLIKDSEDFAILSGFIALGYDEYSLEDLFNIKDEESFQIYLHYKSIRQALIESEK